MASFLMACVRWLLSVVVAGIGALMALLATWALVCCPGWIPSEFAPLFVGILASLTMPLTFICIGASLWLPAERPLGTGTLAFLWGGFTVWVMALGCTLSGGWMMQCASAVAGLLGASCGLWIVARMDRLAAGLPSHFRGKE